MRWAVTPCTVPDRPPAVPHCVAAISSFRYGLGSGDRTRLASFFAIGSTDGETAGPIQLAALTLADTISSTAGCTATPAHPPRPVGGEEPEDHTHMPVHERTGHWPSPPRQQILRPNERSAALPDNRVELDSRPCFRRKFRAPHGHLGRGFDPESNSPTGCGEHPHHDPAIDDHALAELATQNQHMRPSLSKSRLPRPLAVTRRRVFCKVRTTPTSRLFSAFYTVL
jgi:hypothetical protein